MTARFPNEAELTKRRLLNDLLQDGMVTIQLDPRRPGVDVPAAYNDEPALTLNLSHAFNLDVFEVGPYDLTANLSFGGVRHRCVIPYQAIYVMVSQAQGKHLLFPEDVPVELEAQFPGLDEVEAESPPDESDPEQARPVTDHDASTGDPPAEPSDTKDDNEPPPPPAGPHLRLVKK